jgi:MFS family permease
MIMIGWIVAVCLVVPLTGIVAGRMLERVKPGQAAGRRLRRVEPVLAGIFAAAFVLVFVLGAVSSMSASWERQRQVIEQTRPD